MAKFAQKIEAQLDPRQPVPEVCAVIDVMIAQNRHHEEAILRGVAEVIEKRLTQIKQEGEKQDG